MPIGGETLGHLFSIPSGGTALGWCFLHFQYHPAKKQLCSSLFIPTPTKEKRLELEQTEKRNLILYKNAPWSKLLMRFEH